MNLIQDFFLNQLLTRRLNITDTPAPASSLAPEIFPVLDVKPHQAEDHYLRGERMCAAQYIISGGVATYGVMRLYNPANSNTLLVVESVAIGNQINTANVFLTLSADQSMGAPAVTLPTTNLDTRTPPQTSTIATVGIVEQGAFAVVPITAPSKTFARLDYRTTEAFQLGVVLVPGMALTIYPDTFNLNTLIQMLTWRERRVQPSELG